MNKVVITGMGVTSAIGLNLNTFWNNLIAGMNAASSVDSFNTLQYPHHIGCEIKNFESNYISKAEKKVYGRASVFSLHAASEALLNAGLFDSNETLRDRTGVVMGTTYGEAQLIEKATFDLLNGQDKVKSLMQYRPNSLSVNIAKKFGFFGPNLVIPTACSAGNYAIAYGTMLIKLGKADIMIVGGADPFSHASLSGFSRLGAMSADVCRPFDIARRGMLVGEGAGILVLEKYEHAKSRGAKIFAEILSYGLSCDAKHMTIPSIEGVQIMMEKALAEAGVSHNDIDYICAHGTGTPMNDKTEAQAIHKVFYKRGNNVPVSSIKSMLGHAMGAASALSSIASELSIVNGQIPATINFQTQDPECDIDCVPNKSRQKNARIVLNNSLAFGGNNACVVLSKI